jgi:hypothetical protein
MHKGHVDALRLFLWPYHYGGLYRAPSGGRSLCAVVPTLYGPPPQDWNLGVAVFYFCTRYLPWMFAYLLSEKAVVTIA